tara:strand:- start:50 stop:508 length:459 start_codon:yes stop_codon:yes gene_type:complete
MAGPYKMKGSPMQRNFGVGSPMRKTIDPPATQSDSLNAVHHLQGFNLKKSHKSNEEIKAAKTLIKNTKNNIKSTGNVSNIDNVDHIAKKVLQRGDYKNVATTKQVKDLNLPTTKGGSLSTRVKKKRSKKLIGKAVKGTEKNTFGVLKSQKKK